MILELTMEELRRRSSELNVEVKGKFEGDVTAILDDQTRRVAIVRPADGRTGAASVWCYDVIGSLGQTAGRGSGGVSLFGNGGLETKEHALDEARRVFNLPLYPSRQDQAHWYYILERMNRKGRTESLIGLCYPLADGCEDVSLAAFTSEDKALAAAEAEGAGQPGLRCMLKDVRDKSFLRLREIAGYVHHTFSDSYPTVSSPEDAGRVGLKIMRTFPVSVDPVYCGDGTRLLVAYRPSFCNLQAWALAVGITAADLMGDLPSNHPQVLALDILRAALRRPAPPGMTCECGKPASLNCVSCDRPTCFGCMKDGRCPFCRGE